MEDALIDLGVWVLKFSGDKRRQSVGEEVETSIIESDVVKLVSAKPALHL